MTSEVIVSTHHPLQQFPPSIIRNRPSETDRNAIIHPSLLSSHILTKSNHLNLNSPHLNSTIHPNDVIPTRNASTINANQYNGASDSNSQVVLKRPFILNKRRRRDVLLLYNVVSCGTGCNPMRLMGYGCYCGFMGAGIPVDGIDKCCQVHDWCYDNVPCPAFMLYFLRYNWQCYPQPNNCAYRMCQCDRVFAECLKQQPCPNKKVFCRSAPWRLIQNLIFDVGIA
uniref:Phospholipase A2 n=1 Tax=Strigamia maritima TaxID=126957 RepID=T1JLI6_STRMM